MTRATKSRWLRLEQLEDRCVPTTVPAPTTFGLPWPDASRLSLSFAADGTSLDGQSSGLSGLLSALPTDAWKTEILRAFQTWAVHGNINIGLVSDGGQAFGVSGSIQGDSRFGDIRVGARAYDTHLAMNSPYSVLNSTRAGDLVLNTNVTYGIGDPNGYDLYSVILHEAGNVFGIGDNADPTSALYSYYNGIRTGLSTSDITALQTLYGAREADEFEGIAGNDSFATATAIGTSAVIADLTTLDDADYYSFTATTTTVSFRVKASEVSLMTPRLTIYDSNQNVVATSSSTNPLDNTVVIQLDNVVAGTQYFIKVESTSDDVFGIGGYRLKVHDGPASEMGSGVRNNDFTEKVQNDFFGNDWMWAATQLNKPSYQSDSRFDVRVAGRIRDWYDVDYYRFNAPTASSAPQTMTVSVWGLEQSTLYSQLTVYDETGTQVNANVLVNDHGTYVLQVANVVAGANYYVKVAPDTLASNYIGNYLLGINFGDPAAALSSAGAGSLDATTTQSWTTLHNLETQVFHFVLSSAVNALTAVRMTIYDSNSNVVLTLTSREGETVSGNVLLTGGDYHIRFEGGSADGVAMPTIFYDLRAINTTDPIDPMPVDPTQTPTTSVPTFSWLQQDPGFYSFLDLADPYSNPWTGF